MSIPRSPDRLRVSLLRAVAAAVLAVGCTGWSPAAEPQAVSSPASAAERRQLTERRQQAEQAYAASVAECNRQFIVTACVEEAHAKRRTEVHEIERQLQKLDDQDRRQRAADRLRQIDEKQRDAQARRAAAASAPLPDVIGNGTPVELPVQRPAPSAAQKPSPRPPSAHPLSTAQQAANRAAYEKRQQEAADHRAAVESRNASAPTRRRGAALPYPGQPASAVRAPDAAAPASAASR